MNTATFWFKAPKQAREFAASFKQAIAHSFYENPSRLKAYRLDSTLLYMAAQSPLPRFLTPSSPKKPKYYKAQKGDPETK